MNIVIMGAGKIGRGFIAHLLYLSSYKFTFIEYDSKVVELLNEKKRYPINILGNPEKNMNIEIDEKAIVLKDFETSTDTICKTDVIFTAVGGKNLPQIIPVLKEGILKRIKEGNNNFLNIVTCENWSKPAKLILDGICENATKEQLSYINKYVGVSESVIMRSAIEPTEQELISEPLLVNVQDYWYLPIDKDRLKGDFPEIKYVELLENFQGFLDKKFYTYNAANGTTSYIGYLKGYKYISDAAQDKEILDNLAGVYLETSQALCKKYGYDLKEQLAFTKTSLNKLQDKNIVDYIERNARDPIRKLGPTDRLVGPAKMVLEYGIEPEYLSESIACALFYDESSDPFAQKLKNLREENGIDYILEHICDILPSSELGGLVKEKIDVIRKKGWIN